MRSSALAICLVLSASLLVQPLSAQRSRSKNEADRLICRTTLKTGTLAGRERRCFTRADWERIQEGAQKEATNMQERLRSACGQNGGVCTGD